MLNLQRLNQLNGKSREVVLHAENLGISFISGYRKDDYKSYILNFFSRSEHKSVNKTFWPLKNINFVGYQGEILGIIGSNGSGKTTLCKVISGILQPDEGSINVHGRVTALFSLGMGFNKELTGRENTYLNGMMLGVEKKKIDAFMNDIAEFSGLGSFMNRPLKTYSSGMRARLGFSIAAHLEPEILILDEALNTGDRAFGRKAAKKMRELVQKAKMVILVTHSLDYATKHCDRLMWLDHGVIRAIGDSEKVAAKYRATVSDHGQKQKRKLTLLKTKSDIRDRSVVTAENISVSFNMNKGTFWALKDVTFDIKEGEVVGIIGNNGAGKSTLCKVLTKIVKPDSGHLEVKGETTALLNYGTGFNQQLTGADNIFLNGMLLGMSKAKVERGYPEIVLFSGLEKFINKPIKQYSSGMKSRLGFSIAATLRPDIFIIDEALSTGDISFQQKASEKIQEMMESAKAVIVVSHSMRFVENVCTRAIWMDRGKIRFDGDAEEGVKLYKKHVKEKKNRHIKNRHISKR